MPHRASVLMSANGRTADPSFLAERSGAIAAATDLVSLVLALGYEHPDAQIDAAQAADQFLPGAIINAMLGAYRAAAASGTDSVHSTWARSSGFSISVAQEPGSDPETDRGVVALTVRSPKFS